MSKLRILFLHGYHGSAATLRDQARGLASAMMPSAELVFVNAPSLGQNDFGWWHAVRSADSSSQGDPGVDGNTHYRGWSRTRDWLVQVFATQGPFDGVFGFSQGAALTGLLPGLRAADGKPTPERPLRFDFAIMVGGFPAIDPALAALYENKAGYALPSLHIMGRADGIVPMSRSSELAAKFTAPVPGALAGSVDNFFGKRNASEEERRKFSNELHVTAQHPPVFLWTTATDYLVPAAHSRGFAAACKRAAVPVQYTEYPDGSHGLGLALEYRGEAKNWTRALLPWLGQTWGR